MGPIADRWRSSSSGPDRPRLNVAVVTCPTERHTFATKLANQVPLVTLAGQPLSVRTSEMGGNKWQEGSRSLRETLL